MNGKTDQTRNGELRKRQHSILPHGHRMVRVSEANCWITVDASLSDEEVLEKVRRFVRKYNEDRLGEYRIKLPTVE